ncbi:MAG: hypothetical protein LJE63_03800, partial [Desulfobacteraceae bacterium]|nr:hypothetical protein [Desulfobacteraceae bacterium]
GATQIGKGTVNKWERPFICSCAMRVRPEAEGVIFEALMYFWVQFIDWRTLRAKKKGRRFRLD